MAFLVPRMLQSPARQHSLGSVSIPSSLLGYVSYGGSSRAEALTSELQGGFLRRARCDMSCGDGKQWGLFRFAAGEQQNMTDRFRMFPLRRSTGVAQCTSRDPCILSLRGLPAASKGQRAVDGGRLSIVDEQNSLVYKDLERSPWSSVITCCEVFPGVLLQEQSQSISIDSAPKRVDPAKDQPLSLKMLKLKKSSRTKVSMDVEVSSFHSAFSCLIFMLKTLQNSSLSLKRLLTCNGQSMPAVAHAEVQDSLLWLFQQVFACTPKLMLLTMLLLVDFTVHSLGNHVALAFAPCTGNPPTDAACFPELKNFDSSAMVGSWGLTMHSQRDNDVLRPLISTQDHGSFDNLVCAAGRNRGIESAGVFGDNCHDALTADGGCNLSRSLEGDEEQAHALGSTTELSGYKVAAGILPVDDDLRKLICESFAREESEHQQAASLIDHMDLDRETKEILVVPVVAKLEPDDYGCYDKTDLLYQQELSSDPTNPLLLSNYAQFLHLVRHDHSRAEELYKRSIKADPDDGEVLGRFANFLWVARGNVAAADEAYREALSADPSNSFQAGCYAHFLWNCQQNVGRGATQPLQE